MNEREMQFGIGMFVIGAGLVLTMLVVWFGESPSLFKEQVYVTVHFLEAPGVAEGIPVRKSGIRVGEVAQIRFDDRTRISGRVTGIAGEEVILDLGVKGKGAVPLIQFPESPPAIGTNIDVAINRFDPDAKLNRASLPEGVLVTLALDRKYKIKAGAQPRISRALIGDVSIDMLPGAGQGALPTSDNPARAPIIEGSVAPDPTNALAAATTAFEKVGGTLESIKSAADGLTDLTKKSDKVDEFLTSWTSMSRKVGALADRVDGIVKANEGELKPAIANFRKVSEQLSTALDPATRERLKKVVDQLAAGSAKLDAVLTDIGPLAKDLGAPADSQPATNFGQTLMRMNRISYEVGLLTRTLVDPNDPTGKRLNPNGSLQKLVTSAELYDNFNLMAQSARDVFGRAGNVVRNLNVFSERVAKDPAVIGSGVFRK
jgi:phospholipid/cholesterol/gamma-HCH transport system substrate-binding protein